MEIFPVGSLVGLNKSEWDEISQSTFSGLWLKLATCQMAGNMNIKQFSPHKFEKSSGIPTHDFGIEKGNPHRLPQSYRPAKRSIHLSTALSGQQFYINYQFFKSNFVFFSQLHKRELQHVNWPANTSYDFYFCCWCW